MKNVNYDKDIKELFFILILLIFMLGYFTYIKFTYKAPVKEDTNPDEVVDNTSSGGNFGIEFIKNIDKLNDDNYLVSPYSMEVALDMLRKGANGTSLEELNNVLGNREIEKFSVKDRIGIANSLFIKNDFKEIVNSEFSDYLLNTYGSDIIYDDFATPVAINNWCKEKTWNMIDPLLEEIGNEFVIGIANAVAIDVDWKYNFECNNTNSSEFTKSDGSVINVEMMNNSYYSDVKYFENDTAKGVVIPYQAYNEEGNEVDDGTKLEFVGILPNNDIKEYISNFNTDVLNSIDEGEEASNDKKINVYLPRFSYDYNVNDAIGVLGSMGISSVFSKSDADLTNIISKDEMTKHGIENIYVNKVLHKTHIDLNEKGTKAAAVTYIEVSETLGALDVEENNDIDIEFNKPFIYMIRDSASGEILFFGSVYNPNEWNGSTCSSE